MISQFTRDDRIFAVRALHRAGFNNREIADLLWISRATVARYLAAVPEIEWRKFDLDRRRWE